jgi:hypothetical protein
MNPWNTYLSMKYIRGLELKKRKTLQGPSNNIFEPKDSCMFDEQLQNQSIFNKHIFKNTLYNVE